MADEKHPRRPTLPLADDPIGDRTPTNDDIRPLGRGGKINWVAVAKMAAKAIPILITAIAGSIVLAYQTLKPVIEDYTQKVKNKSESGYQVTKQSVEDLQARVLVLERAAQRIQQAEVHAPARGTRRRPAATVPPAVPVVVTASPKPLPSDLDRAEKQVYKAAPPKDSPRGVDSGP